MTCFLLAAGALLSLLVARCEAVIMCPEDYAYTRQPPVGLVCNPYIQQALTIDCAVTGPEGIEIRWYYSAEFQNVDNPFHESTIQLLNSSKYYQVKRTISNGIGLSLTLTNLSNDDVGSYWCQPFAINGSFYLSASASTMIRDEDFYSAIPFPCPPKNINAEAGCARILEFPQSAAATVTVGPTISHGLTDVTGSLGLTDTTVSIGLTDVTASIGLTDVTASIGLTDVTASIGLTDVTASIGLTDTTASLDLADVTTTLPPSPAGTMSSTLSYSPSPTPTPSGSGSTTTSPTLVVCFGLAIYHVYR